MTFVADAAFSAARLRLDAADRELDPRNPLARLARLGEVSRLMRRAGGQADGVATAIGTMDGVAFVAYATDPRRQGGALGADGCDAIVSAYEFALRRRWPIIGVWHSGGARLTEGAASLDGVGRVFSAMIAASGRIPQLSLVLGPAAGGAAYGPALTDLVVLGPQGRVFVTGPDVVRTVTGEDVDMAALGGPEPHSRRSGVAAIVADTDDGAYAMTRRLVGLLAGQSFDTPVADRPLAELLPASARRAYDVRPVVTRLLDEPGVELHPRWAPNLVTTLGRLGGRPVGVLANNPLRLAGCLDAVAGDKAARFVRMCDAFGLPLVVLVDVPGYLPGSGQEWNGVVRRGAKLLHAFASARVPRVTVVLRKAYGGGQIAMNSRSLGATRVLAWPDAEIDVMGPQAAVRVLHRRRLAELPDHERAAAEARLTDEHARQMGGVARAVALGVVDEVVEPDWTRSRLAELLAELPVVAGRHDNMPL